MRKRVSMVILRNKKIYLVKGSTGFYADFYFTPGGKVEEAETDIDALTRECQEELSVIPASSKLYFTYETLIQNTDIKQMVNCYIVEVDTDLIVLKNEITKSYWYSKEDYYSNTPKVANSIYTNLLPALMRDNLI
ncbi:MAG: hypothetical protein ACD_37C00390G0002 [uncultured bacterium]|nr:MAG: hypothetical protein ACD_37C00390G0002 [uncultured bacterium]